MDPVADTAFPTTSCPYSVTSAITDRICPFEPSARVGETRPKLPVRTPRQQRRFLLRLRAHERKAYCDRRRAGNRDRRGGVERVGDVHAFLIPSVRAWVRPAA